MKIENATYLFDILNITPPTSEVIQLSFLTTIFVLLCTVIWKLVGIFVLDELGCKLNVIIVYWIFGLIAVICGIIWLLLYQPIFSTIIPSIVAIVGVTPFYSMYTCLKNK